jgi:YD repeat-containing protein
VKPDERVRRNKVIFAMCVCLLTALLLLLPQKAIADITYVYDAAGRVTFIFDGNGNIFAYTYDSYGNITKVATSVPAFIVQAFSPLHGSAGTAVTIYGAGFSATPSQNTVKFNGTAATMVSSTTQTIVTSVPAGATTGTIYVSVSSPPGAGSSQTSFTIP